MPYLYVAALTGWLPGIVNFTWSIPEGGFPGLTATPSQSKSTAIPKVPNLLKTVEAQRKEYVEASNTNK